MIADTSVADSVAGASKQLIHVRSPHADAFRHLLAAPGVDVTTLEPGLFEVRGLSAEQVGVKAGANHIVLHELTPHQPSLEEAFMDLTREEVEFKAFESDLGSATA